MGEDCAATGKDRLGAPQLSALSILVKQFEAIAAVLDLMNPVGAGRGLVGRGWEAGFDEARPIGGQTLTQQFDRHAG